MHIRLVIFVLLFLSLIPSAFAAESKVWQVFDFEVRAEVPRGLNPFDVDFGAIFTGPGSQKIRVPGFYKDQGTWCVRFSAPEAGNWSGITYSSHTWLSGVELSLTVSENDDPNRHGGIVVDPEHPEKFVYEDGTPYFALAFELDWLYALDYGNGEGIPRSEQILGHVKDNGFNQIVMNVYAWNAGWATDPEVPEKYHFEKPDYTIFGGTNEQSDFTTLNLDFFNHFDRIIHHMDKLGIAAHLMIYVWNKQVKWPDMHTLEDNRYFDYVIARYQAFSNIIWDVSKEALDYGRCDPPYINERIERIRKADAYKRLITVHDYFYCEQYPEKIDFISVQSWRSYLYMHMHDISERHAGMPVMNIEHGGYERAPWFSFHGNYNDPELCLWRNYLCIFAGVYSTYYWQDTSWDIVVWDPFDQGPDFEQPRFDYYKHLAGFFRKISVSGINARYALPVLQRLRAQQSG